MRSFVYLCLTARNLLMWSTFAFGDVEHHLVARSYIAHQAGLPNAFLNGAYLKSPHLLKRQDCTGTLCPGKPFHPLATAEPRPSELLILFQMAATSTQTTYVARMVRAHVSRAKHAAAPAACHSTGVSVARTAGIANRAVCAPSTRVSPYAASMRHARASSRVMGVHILSQTARRRRWARAWRALCLI